MKSPVKHTKLPPSVKQRDLVILSLLLNPKVK